MRAVYIMIAPLHPWRFKLGIAKDAEKRRRQIDRTVTGKVLRVWVVWPPNAKRMETMMHRIYNVWAAPMKKNGGKTNGEKEWFLCVNLIALSFLWLFFRPWWWVALLPLPIDAVATITVLALWAWAWRLGILISIIYTILYLC